MKSVPAIQKVLALAGSDPIVEFYPRPKDASDSDPTLAKPGRLIWPHLVRLAPQGSVIREENLIVELVDYTFLGQGKPIRGVSVNAWVRVQRTDPQTSQPREDVIQAGKVEPGMKVRGFTHLGNVEWPMPVNLDGRQKEVWFNVLAKEVHQVPISLAIGLRGPSSSSEEKGASAAEPTGSPQGELITALDHAEFVGLGTKCAQGAWRRSWHLEPGMHLWAGSHQGDVDYLQQLHEPREIVEFSLGARDRSLNPNNFEVAPTKDASSGRVLVEARPTHAGPIDCNELILLANNKSLPIGDVQENPDVLEPKPDTTIIAGFYRRPDEDPWKNNPLVSRHATTTVKKTISKVTEAFALEFDNGTSLRLGPGNWVLEYDGQIREVFVDLEHLKPGMKIVAGLDERGEPATAALKSIRRILQPENNYVLLEAVNLPWASVNGIVVSVDFRDWHEGTVGLYGATHLARPALRTADLPRSASTDKAPAVPASDPQAPPSVASKPDSPSQMSSVVIAADPLVLPEEFKSPQDLVGQLLAIWDAALARLAPGVVGKIDTYLSTRTVVVSAAKGTTTYRLQCGPAQPLLVKLPGPVDSVSYQYAVDLRPGDRIFVGPPGASVAELWPVTGVRPMFYPGAALYDVVSPARQILHDSREGEADIGFGNSLAYALSVPVAARAGRASSGSRPRTGKDSPGRTQGRQTGNRPTFATSTRPPLVTPPARTPGRQDRASRQRLGLLKQRSSDLLIAFDSERYKLPKTPVDSTAMAFWRQVFQNAPRPTAPETQPAAAAPPLPGDSDSAVDVAFDAWFRLLIHRRNFFLQEENTNTGYLTQVTALEVAMASWLAEAGATETADKLLLDLVELSIYAGCEHADSKRLQARMGKDLELPILLHVSNWVRRQQRASKQEVLMSVSNPALEAARTWADRQNLRATIVKPNGQLSLSGLYAYWASRGKDRTPFWYDILQPDAQGGLSVSPSAKDKGVTPDELRISKDFTTWLQRMTARLLRESPPPDPVGPRPVQVVDLENHDAAQKLGRQKEGGSP